MPQKPPEKSHRISDDLAKKFSDNPEFPFLVSFPRTGSHWLRMLMELYFEKPSLVRAFYYFDSVDFTCYHRHDENLLLRRKNVIYLYREPLATVFSQLRFYNEDSSNLERVKFWAGLYAKHLDKWLFKELDTTKKTILTYEGLKSDIAFEFGKVCEHFGVTLDQKKLKEVQLMVSKEKLKEKTNHDPRVVNLSDEYEKQRESFAINCRQIVFDVLAKQSQEIPVLFKQ